MRAFIIVATVLCGFLAGCDEFIKFGKVDTTALENSSRPVLLNKTTTSYAESLGGIGKGGYYLSLSVSDAVIPSGISTCQDRDSFERFAKEVAGVSEVGALAIVVDVKAKGRDLVTDFPVYMIGLNDNPAPGEDACFSESYQGVITPYFRHEVNLKFDVRYNIKYVSKADVNVLQGVFETATRIASVSGSVGFAASSLARLLIEPATKVLDKAAGKAFSDGQATDIATVQISVDPDFNGVRKDAVRLSLNSLFPGLSVNSGLTVGLNYQRSLLGVYEDDRIDYYTDENTLVTSIYEATSGDSLDMVVAKGNRFAVRPSQIASWNKAEDIPHLEDFCREVTRYLSGDLGLTADDALVLRWAILTKYTNYNSSPVIQTPVCITTPKHTLTNDSDINKLIELDPTFRFVKTTADINRLIDGTVLRFREAMLAREEDYPKFFDISNFSLSTRSAGLLPTSIQDDADKKGIEAIRLLQDVFFQGFCAAKQEENSSVVRSIALFLRVQEKYDEEHPQKMRDKKGRPIVPVVIDLDLNSEKFRAFHIVNVDYAHDLNIPQRWPDDWHPDSNSCCKNLGCVDQAEVAASLVE